jgi:hypothetical protein
MEQRKCTFQESKTWQVDNTIFIMLGAQMKKDELGHRQPPSKGASTFPCTPIPICKISFLVIFSALRRRNFNQTSISVQKKSAFTG